MDENCVKRNDLLLAVHQIEFHEDFITLYIRILKIALNQLFVTLICKKLEPLTT